MRTTTRHRKFCSLPTWLSTWLPTWSALTVGLALSAGSQAHAQGTPAAKPAEVAPPATAEPAPSPPPTQTMAENSPLAEQQLEQVRQMVSAMKPWIEPTGYFRAGFAINSKGGDADAFQAPGAYSKYRLGNETEVYGEFGLIFNMLNPDKNDGAWLKSAMKLAFVTPRNSTFDTFNAFALREAYVQAGHVIDAAPEMSFWAGQRFYRRKDVHIIDFFFHDMSGYGGGFEDLKVGSKSHLAVAYLGGSQEYGPTDPQSDVGRLVKNTIDLRLYNVPAGPGTLEFWLIPTLVTRGSLDNMLNSQSGTNRSGIGGGVFFFHPILGGFNEVSTEFGIGGAANLSTGIDNGIKKNGWLWRLVDRATIQPTTKFSIMWTGVVQLDNKDGNAPGTTDSSLGNLWISFGARPVYNFTKHTGIAVEGGVDIVQPQTANSSTGFVGKLTVAPLIRAGTGFWDRPEIRAFVTTAFWNDTVKGQVGGAAYANANFGLTTGVQAEWWYN